MPDGGIITYEEAIGAPPLAADPAPPTVSETAAPPDALVDPSIRPLTIHGGSKAPAVISYEDAVGGGTPHPGGVLSNAPDDSYASGIAKGTGTAAIKGLSNSMGFAHGLGDLTDYLLARAHSKITGEPVESVLEGYKKARQLQPELLQKIDPMNVLPSPQAIAKPVLNLTGEYVPTSEPGRIAQAGAEAVFSGLGPGGGAAGAPLKDIAAAAPVMAAGNAAAGATGQGISDVTQDPLMGLVGGLAAGGVTQGVAAAGGKLLKPALMSPAVEKLMPGALGQKIAAARENAAAGQIVDQSSHPAALRDWAAQPAQPAEVPGSPQTLAGAVGNDRGLFQAEKDARNANNIPFNAIDKAQSGAQQAAIQGVQPTGDVFAPGQMIRQRLDAIDRAATDAEARLTAAHQQAVAARAQGNAHAQDSLTQAFQAAHERAAQTAQVGAAPLQSLPPAEETGAALRGALQEAQDVAKKVRADLYRAVDPDGTLTVVATPLKAAKADIAAAIDPHTGVQPVGAEAKIWTDIDRLPDVVPFRSLQTLDSRVTAAMSDARRNPSPDDPQAIGRLTQLKSAVMSAINNAAENQAAHEARLVDAGLMRPGETIESRLPNWRDASVESDANVGVQGYPEGYNGPSHPQEASDARFLRTESEGRGPIGGGESDPPTSGRFDERPGLSQYGRPPQNLIAWLRSHGGIRDDGGELASRDLAESYPGLVNNKTGMPLDRAREAAAEAGYLGADREHSMANTTVSDFLNAFDDHPRYSSFDTQHLEGHGAYNDWKSRKDAYRAAAGDIQEKLDQHNAANGIPLGEPVEKELLQTAGQHMVDGNLSWDDALERASIEQRSAEPGRDLHGQATPGRGRPAARAGGEGNGPLDQGSDRDVRQAQRDAIPAGEFAGRGSDAPPNFDPAAAERLAAAKSAHIDYAQTFKNPTVKPALETNGFVGQHKLPNGAVPAKAIVAGDKGYETASAFLKAAGNDPRAVAAMQDAALNPLRKTTISLGMIHPNALARWREQYGPALRALDEAAPGFSSRFDNAADATQALLDLGIQHKQQLADFQRQSAAQALADNAAGKSKLQDNLSTIRQRVSEAYATPAAKLVAQGADRASPVEVENAVGGMLKTGTNGATRMRELVQQVSSDPDALAGLRKAGVDWMLRTHQNADGILSGAKYIDFLRNNRDVLRELYGSAQTSMLGAVARDAEANMKWRTETAIKGGSDTAKNLRPMIESAVDDAKRHFSIASAATAGFLAGGPKGALGGAGLYLLNSLRSAGIRSVDALYREALADPEVARLLISKMPSTPEGGKLRQLTGLVRKSVIVGPMLVEQRAH
jgi:hypothetical protein